MALDPFISRQDVSDYIDRDVTNDAGAIIAVDAACDVCRNISEQDFNSITSDSVTLDGTGTDTLLLPQLPVTNVGTVTVDGTALDADDFAFDEGGHLYRGGSVTWAEGPTSYWPAGRQNVVVSYDHGYAGTVPSDVRLVAVQLAASMITQGGATEETVGSVRKKYGLVPGEPSSNHMRILRKYKRSL